MSSTGKIKKLFAKSDVTVNSKVDDRIVSDALTAFNESEKTKSLSVEPNIWRMIMNRTMTKVAAAAAKIVIVFVGMHYLGVSPDGAGVVWADVLRNMEASQTVTFTLDAEGYFQNECYWRKGTVKIKGPIRRFDGITGRRTKYGQSGEETMIGMMDLSRQNRLLEFYPLKKCAFTADSHGDSPTLLTYDGLKKDLDRKSVV